ncbi:MAG: DUF192 domain-containing protein [Acidimicrobiia bacterium]
MDRWVRGSAGKAAWFWLVAVAGLAAIVVPAAAGPLLDLGGSTRSGSEDYTWEERNIAIGVRCLRIQVADTPEKKAQGLKGRDSLGDFDGMLFPYAFSSDQRAFTMSGVKFPLTIGFYDDAGQRVDALDMEPCPDDERNCPLYRSKGPFRTAVEVAKGQLPDGAYLPTCPA